MQGESEGETAKVSAERQIRRSGNSLVVSIPPLLLEAAELDETDDVTLSVSEQGIELRRERAGG